MTVSRDWQDSWQAASEALTRGDLGSARRIVLSLAESGEWLAYSELGHLCEMGDRDAEADIEKALYWYRKSVFEADDPNGHFGLARLYFNGQGVDRDYEKALSHLAKALSKRGDVVLNERYRVMAYVMLSTIHAEGYGVSKEPEKARAVLKQAVDEGYVWPLFLIASKDLKEGRVLSWLSLRLRAATLQARISSADPHDYRLTGCRPMPALLHAGKKVTS